MDITLAFKQLSLVNGDEITLSIAPSAMKKMIMELVANGYLTTEELVILSIGQLKLCDKRHLEHVLPENVLKKLISTFESVKNGETHER
ncbi:hypothetical protein [Enterobacter hormaechei]|uniref:hypothetical protein n=1 Tax=Enterobacter hormaechei TaxID=158836 RepID=UPI0033642038